MKKIVVLLAAFLASSVAFPVAAETPHEFLLRTYGWTIEPESLLSKFECPTSQTALPSEEKLRGWVCRKQDPEFWTVIYWRLPNSKATAMQEMVYNEMSGRRGYLKPTCESEKVPTGFGGTIEDCQVSITNTDGTPKLVYVSFYHFRAKTKDVDLGFTIWVQNGKTANPAVKQKIREIVTGMKSPRTDPQASTQ